MREGAFKGSWRRLLLVLVLLMLTLHIILRNKGAHMLANRALSKLDSSYRLQLELARLAI